MNAPAPAISTAHDPATNPVNAIDSSCRIPFAILLAASALWLIVFSVLGLIASIKFHSPTFFADSAWLTFGRVFPAARAALVYGFAIPTAVGVALWILSRTGNRPVVTAWLAGGGAVVWNIGVLVGIFAILSGNSTGFENFEMPFYAGVFLITGYLLMGLCLLLTLYARQVRTLSSPQWLIVAATFWFPWIFTTAMLLLAVFPVRGVTQSVIAWWYSANLGLVWVGLIGLAITFDLLVRTTGRRLYSDYLGLLIFWTLLLFGSWTGIPQAAPVPAWIPTLSTVASVLMLVPLLAVLMNIVQTLKGSGQQEGTGSAAHVVKASLHSTVPGRFIGYGIIALAIAWSMGILAAIPAVARIVGMTWFNVAQWQANYYGFFAMTLFGAIYFLVPRIMGVNWTRPGLVRIHFWLAAIGFVLMALPLEIGGLIQGVRINNPEIGNVDLARADLHFLRISTIGELLLMLGHLVFFVNVFGLLISMARSRIVPFYRSAVETLEPVEVRS